MAQSFQNTKRYKIVEPVYELDSAFWAASEDQRKSIFVQLFDSVNTNRTLRTFEIKELETYSGSNISILRNNGLNNVDHVVKVEFEYLACCSSIESHYFLVKNDGIWISLTVLENVQCDGPEPFFEYRFPSQKFGISNQILKTESFPNKNYMVDSIIVKQIYNWDGTKISK